MRPTGILTRVRARLFSVIYKSSTSFPYLSGDAFASLADLVIDSEFLKNRGALDSNLKLSQIVFCPSHLLEELLVANDRLFQVKILLVGNGDKDFHHINPSLLKFAKYVFLQNSFVSDNVRIFTLPIGLENKRLGVNGVIRFEASPAKIAKSMILVGPFSPTAKLRSDLSNKLYENFNEFDVRERRVNLKHYTKELHAHKFVLCPEGNGVDTHRLWESLYAGAIPIVSKNAWSDSLVEQGFPLIQVNSWNPEAILYEVSKFTPKSISAKDISQLWMPYWASKFLELIQD